VALHDPVSQLVHCAPSAAVSTVLVDGVVRLRDGHLVDVDEAALLAEAQQAGRALVGRLES
jgi:hypothetical protein